MGVTLVTVPRLPDEPVRDGVARWFREKIGRDNTFTGMIADPEPTGHSTPGSIMSREFAQWFTIPTDGGEFGMLAVLSVNATERFLHIGCKFIPEFAGPYYAMPKKVIERLDQKGMPRSWPVAMAERVRAYRDSHLIS